MFSLRMQIIFPSISDSLHVLIIEARNFSWIKKALQKYERTEKVRLKRKTS